MDACPRAARLMAAVTLGLNRRRQQAFTKSQCTADRQTAAERTADEGFEPLPPDPAADTTMAVTLLCVFKQHNLFQTCMNPNNWIENSIFLVHTQKHNVSYNYSFPFNNATSGDLHIMDREHSQF